MQFARLTTAAAVWLFATGASSVATRPTDAEMSTLVVDYLEGGAP